MSNYCIFGRILFVRVNIVLLAAILANKNEFVVFIGIVFAKLLSMFCGIKFHSYIVTILTKITLRG